MTGTAIENMVVSKHNNMKKIITIVALLAASSISKANHLSSILSIRNFDGAFISVTLDQSCLTEPSRQFVLNDVDPGNHYLQVKRFIFHPVHPRYQTIYRGYVFVSQSANIDAIITHSHQFKIIGISPLFTEPVVFEAPYYQQVQNNYQPCNYAVSNYDLNLMIKNIERRSFESTKMQLAKQFIDNNYFSSRQIAEMLHVLTFESSKLELAKYAFRRTVDRNNYFVVNDEFTFESSISELSDYISHEG